MHQRHHQGFHQFCPTLDGYNGVSVDTLVKQITSCANFFFIITIAIICLFVYLFILFIFNATCPGLFEICCSGFEI